MNSKTDSAERAAVLAVLLARHYPSQNYVRISRLVSEMQKAARQAVAFGVRACNVPMSEAQENRVRSRLAKFQGELNLELESWVPVANGAPLSISPASVELGGDPRGPCAFLFIPGQRGDGWGDGFAIW